MVLVLLWWQSANTNKQLMKGTALNKLLSLLLLLAVVVGVVLLLEVK
jgi:hypothetical protein